MSRNLTATDARPLAGTTFGAGDLYKSVFGGSNAPVTNYTSEWRPEYAEGVEVKQPVWTDESARGVHVSTLEDSNQNYMKDFLNLIEEVEFGSDDSTKALSALLDTVQSYSILGNSQNSGMLSKAADVLRIIEERAERLFGKTSFWDDLEKLLDQEKKETERRSEAVSAAQNIKEAQQRQAQEERERKDRYGLSQNDYQDVANDLQTNDGKKSFYDMMRLLHPHLTEEQIEQRRKNAAIFARISSGNPQPGDINYFNSLPPGQRDDAGNDARRFSADREGLGSERTSSISRFDPTSPSVRAQAGHDAREFASARSELRGSFANMASGQVNDVAIRALGEPAYNGAQQVTGLERRILGEPAYNGLELNNGINEPSVSAVSFAATDTVIQPSSNLATGSGSLTQRSAVPIAPPISFG